MDDSNATDWVAQRELADFPGADALGIGLAKVPTGADPLPDYLVRHYDWAYLWPVSVSFFDLQPVINAILFGNYRPIMRETLRLLDAPTARRTLQIAGVYGELTPTIAEHISDLHLIDVADVQLKAAQHKLSAIGKTATLRRMNAEALDYPDASFDTAFMFLLLHEMPHEARLRSLREAFRVLRPGGRFVLAEYGELRNRHFLHRFTPMRRLLTWAEPFLGSFWSEDLNDVLQWCATKAGRSIRLDEHVDIFGGFYRVARYTVT